MAGTKINARMKDMKLKQGEDGAMLSLSFECDTTPVMDLDLQTLAQMVGKVVKLTLGPTVDDLPLFEKTVQPGAEAA